MHNFELLDFRKSDYRVTKKLTHFGLYLIYFLQWHVLVQYYIPNRELEKRMWMKLSRRLGRVNPVQLRKHELKSENFVPSATRARDETTGSTARSGIRSKFHSVPEPMTGIALDSIQPGPTVHGFKRFV